MNLYACACGDKFCLWPRQVVECCKEKGMSGEQLAVCKSCDHAWMIDYEPEPTGECAHEDCDVVELVIPEVRTEKKPLSLPDMSAKPQS